MEFSKENINNLTKKIYSSRLRLLTNHPFFGVLVLDLLFALDEKTRTFSTDGKTIFFNPNYLSKLSDYELDFCLLHEIMHIILKHPFKKSNYSDKNVYIERDGALYSEADDFAYQQRVYTETNIPIDSGDVPQPAGDARAHRQHDPRRARRADGAAGLPDFALGGRRAA